MAMSKSLVVCCSQAVENFIIEPVDGACFVGRATTMTWIDAMMTPRIATGSDTTRLPYQKNSARPRYRVTRQDDR